MDAIQLNWHEFIFLGELEILGEKWKKEEILDAKIKKFLAVSKQKQSDENGGNDILNFVKGTTHTFLP